MVSGVARGGGQVADAEAATETPGHVVFRLRRAASLAAACAPCFDDAPGGIGSPRDVQVLDAIGDPGATYSQQDLGDRLGINRSTMVKLIDRFEAAGQVARARNPRDRRSYVLALTDDGRAALDALDPAISEADAKLTAGLTAAGTDRLAHLLAALLHRPAPAPGVPHRTGALLAQAHHHVRHGIETALAGSGLQARHYGALTLLAEGPCSQQQLARRLAISEQAALHVVDDLERTGRVARDRDPADRRRYALRLTEPGRLALRAARAIVESTEAALTAPLGPDGRTELAGLLAELLRTA